jgi:membrane associated rhomboid family serine protease
VSEPDLFVVCKNCSSEVSPYVTECPYCGQRVRKRAPKIDREAGSSEVRPPRRRRAPSLPKLRRDEIPGIAPETRPYATMALILGSLVVTLVLATGNVAGYDLGGTPILGEWWRLVSTPFVHDNDLGYQFVALVATAIFGMHLERRFGIAAVVGIFLLAGAAGVALSDALSVFPAIGANGAALGLLTAWLVDDRLAARRGVDRGNDLLGVLVFGAVLLLVPLAEPDASWAAGLAGAATGAVIGALISPLRR